MRLGERKADLTHVSESALSVVKTFADQAAAGTMPVAEAPKRAMDAIRNMRYGEDGYSKRAFGLRPTRFQLDLVQERFALSTQQG